ncbi:MAG: AEC family transporter [Proteobacteria bacterium]|nr:MAG: AEC family transporter [Pseudomonadota bacterium]
MEKLGLVIVCLILGIALKALKVFPANAAHTLNRFVIYVSLPATTLYYVHAFNPGTLGAVPLWMPIATAWIIFAAALGFFALIAKVRKWPPGLTGALILTAGLGNTSFVGFAVLEALYGPDALPLAILVDQPGTFLALATAGITVAVTFAGKSLEPLAILKRVFTFAPLLALVLALATRSIAYPAALQFWLERLASTLVPLALVAVGMELSFAPASLERELPYVALGLGFKLFLAPILIFGLYATALGFTGLPLKIAVLEAAMAPMITAGIVAAEYELRPELAALMVGIGIPLSLLTVLGWNWALGF